MGAPTLVAARMGRASSRAWGLGLGLGLLPLSMVSGWFYGFVLRIKVSVQGVEFFRAIRVEAGAVGAKLVAGFPGEAMLNKPARDLVLPPVREMLLSSAHGSLLTHADFVRVIIPPYVPLAMKVSA